MDTKSYVITATAQRDSLGNALIKCKHNASLIASAPELLEALRVGVSLAQSLAQRLGLEKETNYRKDIDQMLTALVKADGLA